MSDVHKRGLGGRQPRQTSWGLSVKLNPVIQRDDLKLGLRIFVNLLIITGKWLLGQYFCNRQMPKSLNDYFKRTMRMLAISKGLVKKGSDKSPIRGEFRYWMKNTRGSMCQWQPFKSSSLKTKGCSNNSEHHLGLTKLPLKLGMVGAYCA